MGKAYSVLYGKYTNQDFYNFSQHPIGQKRVDKKMREFYLENKASINLNQKIKFERDKIEYTTSILGAAVILRYERLLVSMLSNSTNGMGCRESISRESIIKDNIKVDQTLTIEDSLPILPDLNADIIQVNVREVSQSEETTTILKHVITLSDITIFDILYKNCKIPDIFELVVTTVQSPTIQKYLVENSYDLHLESNYTNLFKTCLEWNASDLVCLYANSSITNDEFLFNNIILSSSRYTTTVFSMLIKELAKSKLFGMEKVLEHLSIKDNKYVKALFAYSDQFIDKVDLVAFICKGLDAKMEVINSNESIYATILFIIDKHYDKINMSCLHANLLSKSLDIDDERLHLFIRKIYLLIDRDYTYYKEYKNEIFVKYL